MLNQRGQNQKNKRKVLTIREKLRVLNDIDAKMRYVQIAGKYGISAGQVSGLKRNRENIRALSESGINLECKKIRQLEYSEVDKSVKRFLEWMQDQRIPFTCNLIRTKASMVASEHGLNSFRASNGWLQCFLRRSNVRRSVKLLGTTANACEVKYDETMGSLRRKIGEYARVTFTTQTKPVCCIMSSHPAAIYFDESVTTMYQGLK